jgi:hypothetical protein
VFSFKQSTANKLLVGIMDAATGAGVTGLAFNAAGLTFKVAKNGLASAVKTLAAPDWIEVGDGWYWVVLSVAECDTLGVGLLLSYYQGALGSYPYQVLANISSDVMSRLGAPAGASVSADIAAVKTDTATINTRLGAPAGASHAADVAAVSSKLGAPAGASVSADVAAVAAAVAGANSLLAIIRGLMGADSYEDNFIYDGPSGALGSSRLRTYTSSANAAAHGATGLLKTYTMTFGYTGSNLTSVQITEA